MINFLVLSMYHENSLEFLDVELYCSVECGSGWEVDKIGYGLFGDFHSVNLKCYEFLRSKITCILRWLIGMLFLKELVGNVGSIS